MNDSDFDRKTEPQGSQDEHETGLSNHDPEPATESANAANAQPEPATAKHEPAAAARRVPPTLAQIMACGGCGKTVSLPEYLWDGARCCSHCGK